MQSLPLERPKPNVKIIVPAIPLDWRATLTSQIIPIDPTRFSSPDPVFMGEASSTGALVEGVSLASMVIEPTGYDVGAGGKFGLGTLGNEVKIRIYSKFGDGGIDFFAEFTPNSQARFTSAPLARPLFHPILPSGSLGWRLRPGEKIYVGLSKAIALPGANLFIRGGQYSKV